MFTRLVVLFIATSLHKSAGLEGITQFSFAEQPPKVEVKPTVEEPNSLSSPEVLPQNSGVVESPSSQEVVKQKEGGEQWFSKSAKPGVVESPSSQEVVKQKEGGEQWFSKSAKPGVVEPSSQEVLPQRLETPGENGAGIPKAANEEVKPIVPPVAEKDEEIRGLKNPFTSNPQLTDADQRLQDFSKQLKEASTQMSGLYDTLVAQMDLYKHVLGTMVHNSRTLMSNMKVMLHEEGTALEMKNQARMKPVLGLDALIKEHHEILEVAGVGEDEGPEVEVKHKVNGELPEATVEVHTGEANSKVNQESQNEKVEGQPNVKEGWFKGGEANPEVNKVKPE